MRQVGVFFVFVFISQLILAGESIFVGENAQMKYIEIPLKNHFQNKDGSLNLSEIEKYVYRQLKQKRIDELKGDHFSGSLTKFIVEIDEANSVVSKDKIELLVAQKESLISPVITELTKEKVINIKATLQLASTKTTLVKVKFSPSLVKIDYELKKPKIKIVQDIETHEIAFHMLKAERNRKRKQFHLVVHFFYSERDQVSATMNDTMISKSFKINRVGFVESACNRIMSGH
ncbi:MAG: hypothetical protein H6622_07280 [Halobacteriovoraceae bacterium]|nr:hypothetical protein [Halobacteriovoraceae bacterium]